METNVANPDNDLKSAEAWLNEKLAEKLRLMEEMRRTHLATLNEMLAKALRLKEQIREALLVRSADRAARPELPVLDNAEEFSAKMREMQLARLNEEYATALRLIEEIKREITHYQAARDQFLAAAR